MKKYLLLTALVLATTAQADFWSNCTTYGGTIITANKYGADKGGYCNDPNDTNLTNNCNGKRFCIGGKKMNWWSAFTWCEAIGGKLASFTSMCPNTQAISSNTTDGECPNLTKVAGNIWAMSSMGWDDSHNLHINLSNGRLSKGAGSAATTRAYSGNTLAILPFCEEK